MVIDNLIAFKYGSDNLFPKSNVSSIYAIGLAYLQFGIIAYALWNVIARFELRPWRMSGMNGHFSHEFARFKHFNM